MNKADSFAAMMAEVRAFHAKHRFAERGGEDMVYRVALMAEELGEISACVSKGKPAEELAEECADLLILLMGNAIAADFDLAQAFREKMAKINRRGSRIIDGRVRVSNFSADSAGLANPADTDTDTDADTKTNADPAHQAGDEQ